MDNIPSIPKFKIGDKANFRLGSKAKNTFEIIITHSRKTFKGTFEYKIYSPKTFWAPNEFWPECWFEKIINPSQMTQFLDERP